jgi:integration host factor subunit alpha
MSLTKVGLVDKIWWEHLASTRAAAAEMIDLVFEMMKARLAEGENVKLSGFGNFTVSDKATRMGRNPQTGGKLEISARRVVKFRASQVLKGRVNEG